MKNGMSRDACDIRDMLRRKMSRLRLQLTEEEYGLKDSQITDAIMRTDLWQNCSSVFAYCAMDGEPDMTVLTETALREGKVLALPRCLDEEHMVFGRVRDLSELEPGMYGIMEPRRAAENDLIEPDSAGLMLIPCLAFDERGYRLGHGKGYYDRYLARTASNVNTMIAAYSIQQTERLPITREDVPALWIATEEGVIPSRQIDG